MSEVVVGTEINLGYNLIVSTCMILKVEVMYLCSFQVQFSGKTYYIWDACRLVGFIEHNATKRQRPPIFVQTDMRRMLNLMNNVRDEENYCRKGVSNTICVSAASADPTP